MTYGAYEVCLRKIITVSGFVTPNRKVLTEALDLFERAQFEVFLQDVHEIITLQHVTNKRLFQVEDVFYVACVENTVTA